MNDAVNSDTDFVWRLPPASIRLCSKEVHIWRASLVAAASQMPILKKVLNDEERHRAEQFFRLKDHDNYIITRGILRHILSRYLNINASQLQFDYNAFGKPFLAKTNNGDDVRFNLSHSGELALYAITRNRDVGIDVEDTRIELDFEQIAAQFFSVQEFAELRALPEAERMQGFYNCWTRKEAYVKAKGRGFSLDLKKFDVTLTPNSPAALLQTKDEPADASRWSLVNLPVNQDYVAALAVEGHDFKLKCWRWLE